MNTLLYLKDMCHNSEKIYIYIYVTLIEISEITLVVVFAYPMET